MGAHVALYAATNLSNWNFYGLIIHNAATMPKKVKMSKDELKRLQSYLPEGNLHYWRRLSTPVLLLHNTRNEWLGVEHAHKIADSIPQAFYCRELSYITNLEDDNSSKLI